MPIPELSIVIPAYNEAERLGPTLMALLADLSGRPIVAEVIVVDDGSTDGTAALAQTFESSSVRVLAYQPNGGKGRAVRTGMLAARGRIVGFMDADLSTDLEALDRALAALHDGYDIVIGSRGLRSSQTLVHQPLYRRVGARVFNVLQHALSGVRGFEDTQCGFKFMTAEAAHAIFGRAQIDGFMFDVEALFLAQRLGFRVLEMPVIWRNDPASRLRLVRDTARMFRDLARVRWAARDLPARSVAAPSHAPRG